MNIKLLPILVFLWIIGGHALGQVNLLPHVNFKHPGVNTGWAEGFNIPNNQEFKVIAEGGKHWLRIENRDAGRQLDYVHAFVNVTPQIASLTVSVRMKATDLKIGKEGWHTARVALMFEGGSFDFPPEVPELRADSDWVTKSVELKVPKGANRLNIQPAMFYCTGVFEIAELTVTPHMVAPTHLADAVLPAGVKQAGRAEFVTEMLDEKGGVEKTFVADAAVDAKEAQTVTLSWPWANQRLWDVSQPNLYTLRLKVRGAGLDGRGGWEGDWRKYGARQSGGLGDPLHSHPGHRVRGGIRRQG